MNWQICGFAMVSSAGFFAIKALSDHSSSLYKPSFTFAILCFLPFVIQEAIQKAHPE
jgi:hypothetical protein